MRRLREEEDHCAQEGRRRKVTQGSAAIVRRLQRKRFEQVGEANLLKRLGGMGGPQLPEDDAPQIAPVGPCTSGK